MTADLHPLMAPLAARCAMHPAVAAGWKCATCQRGYCGPCQRRVDGRVTPLGTCLQCGGQLDPVRVEANPAPSLWKDLRHAYGPQGVAFAAALGLPMLYAGFVVSTLPVVAAVTAACMWTYFLGVVRWRATANPGLPPPGHVLEDLRQAMAAFAGLLAVVLALVPALYALVSGVRPAGVAALGVVALLWLPVPVLAAAARPGLLGPLLPIRALRAVATDPFGYLGAVLRTLGLAAAALAVGAVLARAIGWLPGLGLWLVAVGALPAAWAVALAIGRWGHRHADMIGFDA